MKKLFPLVILLAFGFIQTVFAQSMVVKKPDFKGFHTDKKHITQTLERLSSPEDKKHPEYGILPYNAPCNNCVELIGSRTINYREFMDTSHNGGRCYQKSYFPLHYKNNENDVWHTIDSRLKPVPNRPGIYAAPNQPDPTGYNTNTHTSSISVNGFEFQFNQHLSMYFFDEGFAYSKTEQANYSNYTIGEEGLHVKNVWTGIDMEQVYKAGEIETNYVINAPLQIPVQKGYMVIKDEFTLPEGYTFQVAKGSEIPDGDYYRGAYVIKNAKGEKLITYNNPVYLDARAYGQHGSYKVERNGNSYSISFFVPVNWLNRTDNTYPLLIDPLVFGQTKIGDFRSVGLSANMGFSTRNNPGCDYHMTVPLRPGSHRITNTNVDLEYQLTYDNTCGTPPLPAPYCTFSQVTMEVKSDVCGTTTGLLACNPALPPFTGTCTTDSALVPGAHAIVYNSSYLNCYSPVCVDTLIIPFTLTNKDSICGDTCGYLCARGNMWQMTVFTCNLDGYITQDVTKTCAGQPVTFTVHPNDCGVPPYTYLWTTDGGNTYDTITNSTNFVIHPQVTTNVSCVILDNCPRYVQQAPTNDLTDTVLPTPSADAGAVAPMCEGGSAQLGGQPTTNGGANVSWSGENATVQGWLSSTAVPNPTIVVPPGTVDSFFYVVRCFNNLCSNTDTVWVYSLPNPIGTIDTTGSTTVCAGQTVNIAVTDTFISYLWNNGATTQSVSVSQPGAYYAIVTDQNHCHDTTNSITIANVSVPSLHVYPDTLIQLGDSVMLYTDINLASASVDSFTWYPAVNLSCTNCNNPYATPTSDEYFALVAHINGCTVSDSALIRIILPNNFFIPNAFTPNGDGNNDQFFIFAQNGVRVLSFQIFNRTGEKVYDDLFPWDGTYKGKPAPPGVYVYMFKLGLYGEDRAIYRKGSVTLIR